MTCPILDHLLPGHVQIGPERVPLFARLLGECRTPSQSDKHEKFAELSLRLTAIADGVHRRASDARIIFIDYSTVLPVAGRCKQLPLTELEIAQGLKIAMQLESLTADVALKSQSGLIRASEFTRHHDVCSAEPWNQGFHFPDGVFSFGPAPYHPTREAMQAIADKLAQLF